MHEMQTIPTGDPERGVSVYVSVNLSSVSLLRPAKTAERINSLFGLEIVGGQRDIVLVGSPDTSHNGFDAALAKLLWPVIIIIIR